VSESNILDESGAGLSLRPN